MELYLDPQLYIDSYLEGIDDTYDFNKNNMTCNFPKVNLDKITTLNFAQLNNSDNRLFISNLTVMETLSVLKKKTKFYSDPNIPALFRTGEVLVKAFNSQINIIHDNIEWNNFFDFFSKAPTLAESSSKYKSVQYYIHLYYCFNTKIQNGDSLFFLTNDELLLKYKNEFFKSMLKFDKIISIDDYFGKQY